MVLISNGKSLFVALLLFVSCCLTSTVLAQWVTTNAPAGTTVSNFAVIDTILFTAIGDRIGRTSDYGDHWIVLKDSLMVNDISALESSGKNLYAAVPYNGVILSQDNGGSWKSVSNGLFSGVIHTLKAIDTELFAGTDIGPYVTADTGANWSLKYTGIENHRVLCFAKEGQYDFAGIFMTGIYRSSNNGSNWEYAGFVTSSITAFAVNGVNLYAATDVGPARSTDNGFTWDTIIDGLIMVPFVNDFAVHDTDLFAGTGYGVFLLNNNRKWVAVNEGLPKVQIFSLAICGKYLFAGTTNGQVYRRPLSEITGINAVGNISKNESSISSFPNPFTQSTSIKFTTDKPGFARISVLNLLGAEVAEVFAGEMESGEHSVSWDARGLPAGMYLCMLRTAGRTEELPVMLVK